MRVLRVGAAIVGIVLLFVVALAAGVLLHLDTPRARRLVADEVNLELAPSFRGRVTVGAIGGIGLLGVTGTDATVSDPSGRRVLDVHGARVDLATLAAARSALLDTSNPLTIDLSDVAVDSAEVLLDTDAAGNLGLADAFQPRVPSPSPPPGAPPGRGVRLDIPSITLRHAWVHGQLAGAPPLDVVVDELRASLIVAPDFLEGDVARARITARRIANGADVTGALEAHAKIPTGSAQPTGRAAWHGTVGTLAGTVDAKLEADRVDAVMDAPRVGPGDVRAIWPGSTLTQTGKVHVEAHGLLADIAVTLDAALGPSSVELAGHVDVDDARTARAHLEVRDVDLHALAPSAPRSRLGLSGNVSAAMKADGSVAGDAGLRLLAGTLEGHAVPAASIDASGSRSGTGELGADAVVIVDEPGAPTHLKAHLAPEHGDSILSVSLQSEIEALERVPELRRAASGSTSLDASAEVNLTRGTLDGRVQARAASLVIQGATRARTATVVAHARGPLAVPELDVTASARGVQAAGRRFDSVDVQANGKPTAVHVVACVRGPDTPDADADVTLGLGDGVALSALRATLAGAGERAIVTAREVSLRGGEVRVDDGRIEGLGAPLTANVRLSPGELTVRAATQGLDLARIARLGHFERTVTGGTLSLDTDLRLRRGSGTGKLTLDASHVGAGGAKDASAHLDASIDGRMLATRLHAEVPGAGILDVAAPKIVVGGADAWSASSWKRASGALDVDVHTDLARLAALFPPERLPLSEAHGTIVAHAHVERSGGEPGGTLTLTTDQLVLASHVDIERDIDGVLVRPLPAWRIAGVDVAVDAGLDAATGALKLDTRAHDARGPLGQLDATFAHLPYAELMGDTGRLIRNLWSTPLDLHLSWPERGLGTLPPMLQQPFVTGRLQGDLHIGGTAMAPAVTLTAALRHGSFTGNTATTPLDVDVSANYDGRRGTASAKVHSGSQELLTLEGKLEALASQFLPLEEGAPAPVWTASASGHLTSFPMASVAALDDKRVAGQVTGDFSLSGLHQDAHAHADLSIAGLAVGTVVYRGATVRFDANGQALDASLHIDQADGFLQATTHGKATWGAAMTPTRDRSTPLEASISAKSFRIAALLPLVDAELDELDGRLDADTKAELDPSAMTARLSGSLSLRDATIAASAGGGELHGVDADVQMTPDGTITLSKLTASGVTGRLTASGKAHFQGATIDSAHAVITIPGGSSIPVTAGGSELGNVDGSIEVDLGPARAGQGLALKVQVPRLGVRLPEGSTTDAQSLGSMAKVRIGAHRGDRGRLVLLPLDPPQPPPSAAGAAGSRLTIETHLGNVHVVRGTELAVDLGGDVQVTNLDAPQVTGRIALKKGGTLSVQGRMFSIENGTVTFVGKDPSNPQVVVKAGWVAPAGAGTVYATFTGPLKTGKVTLTSEPEMPREEIVQLLLFGSADGVQAQAPSSSTENSAIATAGGEAAQPLNHMLNQLGLGAVTAKIDTSEAANPKPEVEVQIAKDISVEIAVVMGQPPPGVNPDVTLLTLDWRFLSKWSLATTVGNAGTTIFDLLWQKRY